MGSWNETCWLSGLPIMSNDDCLLVLLRESQGYRSDRTSGFTYNHGLWHPFALPIAGWYDDYGKLTGWDNNSVLEVVRTTLRKSVVEYPMGENRYHDLPVSKEMFDEDDWLEQIQNRMRHGKGLSLRTGNRIGSMLIRKDVYDSLAERSFESYSGKTIDLDYRRDKFKEFVALEAKLQKSLAEYSAALIAKRECSYREVSNARIKAENLYFLEPSWRPELIKKQAMIEDDFVEEEVVRFLQVAEYADSLSKMWGPTCSGNDDLVLHRDFAEIVHRSAKKIEHRFLDECSSDACMIKLYNDFWSKYPRVKVLEYEERVYTDDIIDANGNLIPGMEEFGELRAISQKRLCCLFIILDERKSLYTYVLYDDDSDKWLCLEHDVPPNKSLTKFMLEAKPPEIGD